MVRPFGQIELYPLQVVCIELQRRTKKMEKDILFYLIFLEEENKKKRRWSVQKSSTVSCPSSADNFKHMQSRLAAVVGVNDVKQCLAIRRLHYLPTAPTGSATRHLSTVPSFKILPRYRMPLT